MIKETLTYKDFNGDERTNDYYFHMTKLEWLRFDRKYGGLREFVQKATKDNDEYGILTLLEELIQTAYGEKSSDGLRFVKSPEITERFTQSDAYSDMVISFLTDTQKGIDFFNRLAPADLNE
jgi:hypothetical protein